jgi:hypothetical protein
MFHSIYIMAAVTTVVALAAGLGFAVGEIWLVAGLIAAASAVSGIG